MRWLRISPIAEARLDAVLKSWLRTPYAAGSRVRGMGVDCKELIPGVLDEMYRKEPSTTRRLAPDSGMRDIRLGLSEIRLLMRQYPDVTIVRDGTVQPGDVIVTRSSNFLGATNHPGHAMIAGVRPGEAYHAHPRSGVVKTSIAAAGKPVVRIYRTGKKGTWS